MGIPKKNNSPFEHQIQPVSNHSHPDELDGHRGLQVNPNWEEDEEGVPEVRCPGDPEKQPLGVPIVGLQVVGAVHTKTLNGIHYCIKHLSLEERCLLLCEKVQPNRESCSYQGHSWLILYQGLTTQTHAHADLWTLPMCNKTQSLGRLSHKQGEKIAKTKRHLLSEVLPQFRVKGVSD